VRLIATTEPVTLHHAFKTTALGQTDRIDKITYRENIRPDHVARFDFLGEITNLLGTFGERHIVLFEMAGETLGHPLLAFLIVKAELHRLVAVRLDGFHLHHAVRSSEHHSHRDNIPGLIIDAGLS
jgi:hypothetical protein